MAQPGPAYTWHRLMKARRFFKLAAAILFYQSKMVWRDGVTLSTAFLGDAAVADFVIKIGFFAPSFGLSAATQAKWEPVAARIKLRQQNRSRRLCARGL